MPRKGNDGGSQEGLQDLDLLSLWRMHTPDTAPSWARERLSAAVVARARTLPSEEFLETLLLRAEARDPFAWISLSKILPARLEGFLMSRITSQSWTWADLEGSCLWMAVAIGLPWACAVLALRVVGIAEDDATNPHLLSLAARYSRMADIPSQPADAVMDLGIHEAIKHLFPPLREPDGKSTAERSGEVQAPGANACGPTIRVLAATPPIFNREDKALVDRYAALAKPVALAPMPDPDDFAVHLLAEFPWMPDIVEAIRSSLVLAQRLGCDSFKLSPLLVIGPSGVGKSRLARRLAVLAGVPMGQVMAAGSGDNRVLAGTGRGWSTTMPCLPLIMMLASKRANPIIIVDGIDDSGGSGRNGAIDRTLLGMLDPATAQAWPDECLLVPADLSRISWILLARREDRVPADLRSRCRILRVPWPRAVDFDVIFKGALADIADEFRGEVHNLPEIDPQVIDVMRTGFAAGRLQARQLAMIVRRALAAAAGAERTIPRH